MILTHAIHHLCFIIIYLRLIMFESTKVAQAALQHVLEPARGALSRTDTYQVICARIKGFGSHEMRTSQGETWETNQKELNFFTRYFQGTTDISRQRFHRAESS